MITLPSIITLSKIVVLAKVVAYGSSFVGALINLL
jgi:hypothetical protein